MATQTLTYKTVPARAPSIKAFVAKYAGLIKRHAPSRKKILYVGLLLAGLGLPFLMFLEIIPASLLLGFLATGLIISGGILALVYV